MSRAAKIYVSFPVFGVFISSNSCACVCCVLCVPVCVYVFLFPLIDFVVLGAGENINVFEVYVEENRIRALDSPASSEVVQRVNVK